MAALRVRPDSPGVRINIDLALEQNGGVDGADAHYRGSLRPKPDHRQEHNGLRLAPSYNAISLIGECAIPSGTGTGPNRSADGARLSPRMPGG